MKNNLFCRHCRKTQPKELFIHTTDVKTIISVFCQSCRIEKEKQKEKLRLEKMLQKHKEQTLMNQKNERFPIHVFYQNDKNHATLFAVKNHFFNHLKNMEQAFKLAH